MRPDGITGSNTSHSNSQCGAKYLTAPLNEPLCWLLCDPQKKIPSPDFTQTSAVTRNSNKLLYVSRLFCSSSYTLHTMTPTARSFVRARQTWTKSLCEGVENPPPLLPSWVVWQNGEWRWINTHTTLYVASITEIKSNGGDSSSSLHQSRVCHDHPNMYNNIQPVCNTSRVFL